MENMKNTTITREIAGNYVNFTLTDAEMESAYNEYQFQDDVITTKARLKESGEYKNWEEIPYDLIEKLAREFRAEMKNMAETMGDGSIPAMESVFSKHEYELERYKEKWKLFNKEVTLTLTKEYTIKAKTKEEADAIFENWAERHADRMTDDLTDDAQWDGDWDYGYTYEDGGDPDDADITPDD